VIAKDAAVVGTQRGDWSPDSDGKPTTVEIGDFCKLGELLAEMSGEPPSESADAT
jgi:hypothetical protein